MAENFDEAFWMFDGNFEELLYINDRGVKMYGVTREELKKNPMSFLDEVHPSDVESVKEALERLRNGEKVSLEYRVNSEENYQRWVDVQGVPVLDEEGTMDKIIGSSRDITERKTAELELYNEKQRLEAVVSLQDSVAQSEFNLDQIMQTVVDSLIEIINADGAVIEVIDGSELVYRSCSGNIADQTGLGIPVDESLSGKCYRTGTKKRSDDIADDQRVDQATIEESDFECGSMLIIPLGQGDDRFGVLKVLNKEPYAFTDSDENVLNLIGGMVSASMSQAMQYEEKEKYLEQVLAMAHTDALTGLDNRRKLMSDVNEEIDRAVRYEHPLSFGILDLDRFKEVNDTYGHQTGDDVLRRIGQVIRSSTRDTDTAGRYGGEEFAFVLPETDLDRATELSVRLLDKLRQETFSSNGSSFSITASIGLAEYEPGFTQDEFINEADKALYEAKTKGRDCVQTA
jgi:diguanylate cyclase (GGDEF)-like protein/PAS domain S-box-containing protein